MTRTWLSIRVDLAEGRGEQYWPRPGRIFAAAHSHTFKQLADAIDDAFARWDRSHLQEFTLADGRRLCDPDPDWEIEGEVTDDYRRVKLSRLHPGEQFAYVFDLGDDWAHLCAVGARRIDPAEALGILPEHGVPGVSPRMVPGRSASALRSRPTLAVPAALDAAAEVVARLGTPAAPGRERPG